VLDWAEPAEDETLDESLSSDELLLEAAESLLPRSVLLVVLEPLDVLASEDELSMPVVADEDRSLSVALRAARLKPAVAATATTAKPAVAAAARCLP
jgi:ribosomal protein L12E/L44/L45/RPP1/RPP2